MCNFSSTTGATMVAAKAKGDPALSRQLSDIVEALS